MKFDVSAALKKSTGRAKSDVANKLVSMLLHEISRIACAAGGMTVSDPRYAESVVAAFGTSCLYCGKQLEPDRTTVEHLNGMNRVSVGLHVPGNVAMACKKCNNAKRQDDQHLLLADNGWESFLSHDGRRCASECPTCAYWIGVLATDDVERYLAAARIRIQTFQAQYQQFVQWSADARDSLRKRAEKLYRDCQTFATNEITALTSDIQLGFSQGPRPSSPNG
ncbi:MAG: HNH endonuclease [Verrucomicrobia bacterium]|nr:HNH endonuclease [Verrucomicrobiota bacterium]